MPIYLDLKHMRDDAHKWAEAFCQQHGTDVINQELMVVWFANAIETSWQVRIKRVREFLAQIT